MKKLFGHKPKSAKSRDFGDDPAKQGVATPVYQKLATHGAHIHNIPMRNNSVDDERWEVVRPLDIDQNHLPNPHPAHPTINTPSRNNSFTSLPSAAQPLAASPAPPRSSSPMSVNTQHSIPPPPPPNKLVRAHDPARDAHFQTRKKPQATAPVAIGILRALDPPAPTNGPINPARSASEERLLVPEAHKGGEHAERKEKRGFWGSRDKEKDKDKEREAQQQRDIQKEMQRDRERLIARDPRGRRDDDNELTRMIGYLTATASEDWDLVMDVCRRASSNESNAKEAARALRREFKYGEPPAQLSAARLWAIMLRNSTDVFITHTTTRKFLDTLEELLNSPRTAPVVRERLLDIVAAAAYASRASKQEREGFKGLWKRVKPVDKPDEGIPFDTSDAMLLPPAPTRTSGYEQLPIGALVDGSIIPDSPTPGAPRAARPPAPRHNRVIPQEEDMNRLSKECTIGVSNAQVLSQSLIHVKPDELKKSEVIKEFYVKCRRSHELIFGQIAWATALAEQATSRREQKRKRNGPPGPDEPKEEITPEEKLLADLLQANEELQSALNQYSDMQRIHQERKAQERSKREFRREQRMRTEADADTPTLSYLQNDASTPSIETSVEPPVEPTHQAIRSSSSRSPSPSSRNHSPVPTSFGRTRGHLPKQPSVEQHDQDHLSAQGHGLAPPRAVPHGPRLPAPLPLTSRTPSPVPDTPKADAFGNGRALDSDSDSDIENEYTPIQPSAKALGKRKQVEPENGPPAPFGSEGSFYGNAPSVRTEASGDLDQDDDDDDDRWHTGHNHTHFVYDAVAERTREVLENLKQQRQDVHEQQPHQNHTNISPPQLMVNGVH